MQAIIELSALLENADKVIHATRSRNSFIVATTEQRRAVIAAYQVWADQCRARLPDDLRTQFNKEFGRTATIPESMEGQAFWSFYMTLAYEIEVLRSIVASARLRLWDRQSCLPRKERRVIAQICKDAYRGYTIAERFIASGCEPHWYIPPFDPWLRSERANITLGWLDGILLYAPDREVGLLRNLCDILLDNERLKAQQRARVEQVRELLNQPAPTNPLDRFPLHPTVRTIAAPLVAISHYDEAILKTCIALNNAVQALSGRPDLDGSRLMNSVFARDAPVLQLASELTEQQGWMFLFTGAIQALRNPRAHKLGQDTSFDEMVEWLFFLSALFRALDRATLNVPIPSSIPTP